MKDNLEKRIKELHGQFDFEEPTIGHFNRFEAKLARHTEQPKTVKWNPTTWKWLAVAASIALVFTLYFGGSSDQVGMQLSEVSPEMEETESFLFQRFKMN